MNKKSQTKQIKPRRTKGRVYQMGEGIDPNTASPSIPTSVSKDAAIITTFKGEIHESICDKARRLANDAEETQKKKRAERELAFLRKMFETDDLAGAGVVVDKVRKDGTIEYLICGRRWRFGGFLKEGLLNLDDYLGFMLTDWIKYCPYDLESFGKTLQYIDKHEAELRAEYPDNWWGRLKAWWHQFSIF